MHGGVAGTAKRNEVFLRILPGRAPKYPMVATARRNSGISNRTHATPAGVQPESQTQAGSLDLIRRSAWVRDCVPATVTSVTECTERRTHDLLSIELGLGCTVTRVAETSPTANRARGRRLHSAGFGGAEIQPFVIFDTRAFSKEEAEKVNDFATPQFF